MSPRQRPQSQNISMAPVAIIVVVIAAVAGFLAMNSSAERDEAEGDAPGTDQAVTPADAGAADPFADLDPVAPPETYERATAPPGLLENADYVRAVALAEQGIALVDEAMAAREAGDEEAYQAEAREGRDLIFEAKALTTDWLMQLQEDYPKDRQVRQIETSRRSWDRALKKVKNLD